MMNKNNYCPECGNSLAGNLKRCSCGWLSPQQIVPAKADHVCSYRSLTKRCPLPGTISPSRNGTWYCRRHYRTLHDPKLGEVEFLYIEKNYCQILTEEYGNWRTDLLKINSKN